MPKRPRLRVVKEDPPLIATTRVIMIIGSSRYALDISTRCTQLKPSRPEVIPINRQQKGTRKPLQSGSSEVIWDHLEVELDLSNENEELRAADEYSDRILLSYARRDLSMGWLEVPRRGCSAGPSARCDAPFGS